jgi:PhnB protein
MTFCRECLGGELALTRLADTPMKSQFPTEKHERIIDAPHLVSGGLEISAADWMASPDFEPVLGNLSAIFVTSESDEELARVFGRLAQGAKEEWFQPLHEMPFGTYGQFFDRYGIQWIFRGARVR